MMTPPILKQRKRFLNGKEQALDVDVEDLVEVLLRNGAQRGKSSCAGVGENDIEMPFLLLDRRIEPIQIRQL